MVGGVLASDSGFVAVVSGRVVANPEPAAIVAVCSGPASVAGPAVAELCPVLVGLVVVAYSYPVVELVVAELVAVAALCSALVGLAAVVVEFAVVAVCFDPAVVELAAVAVCPALVELVVAEPAVAACSCPVAELAAVAVCPALVELVVAEPVVAACSGPDVVAGLVEVAGPLVALGYCFDVALYFDLSAFGFVAVLVRWPACSFPPTTR